MLTLSIAALHALFPGLYSYVLKHMQKRRHRHGVWLSTMALAVRHWLMAMWNLPLMCFWYVNIVRKAAPSELEWPYCETPSWPGSFIWTLVYIEQNGCWILRQSEKVEQIYLSTSDGMIRASSIWGPPTQCWSLISRLYIWPDVKVTVSSRWLLSQKKSMQGILDVEFNSETFVSLSEILRSSHPLLLIQKLTLPADAGTWKCRVCLILSEWKLFETHIEGNVAAHYVSLRDPLSRSGEQG